MWLRVSLPTKEKIRKKSITQVVHDQENFTRALQSLAGGKLLLSATKQDLGLL